ncbi:ABC transporter permease [Reyranella sp. CPCC 100927]|nr:ABC transporter permease [Reyranella sp. CPCC 100927]
MPSPAASSPSVSDRALSVGVPAFDPWRLLRPLQVFISPLVLLALWEIGARTGMIETKFFPAPTTIGAQFAATLMTAEFWNDLRLSLSRLFIGLLMGGVPGLLLGLAMGLSRAMRVTFQPLIAALYPLPKIAILPLILLMFGLGEMSKYVIVAIGVFFLMTLNTFAGVINIKPIYFDVARNLKASRWQTYVTVALPGAVPGILTGLRICVGSGLLLLVAAEFVGADAGIGYRIWWSWSVFWVEPMYVGLMVIAILGFAFAYLIDFLEGLLLPWLRR